MTALPIRLNATVWAIVVQPDGKVLAGGEFVFNHLSYVDDIGDRIFADGS